MKQIEVIEAGVWAGNSFEKFDSLGGNVMMFCAGVFPFGPVNFIEDPGRASMPIPASF